METLVFTGLEVCRSDHWAEDRYTLETGSGLENRLKWAKNSCDRERGRFKDRSAVTLQPESSFRFRDQVQKWYSPRSGSKDWLVAGFLIVSENWHATWWQITLIPDSVIPKIAHTGPRISVPRNSSQFVLYSPVIRIYRISYTPDSKSQSQPQSGIRAIDCTETFSSLFQFKILIFHFVDLLPFFYKSHSAQFLEYPWRF